MTDKTEVERLFDAVAEYKSVESGRIVNREPPNPVIYTSPQLRAELYSSAGEFNLTLNEELEARFDVEDIRQDKFLDSEHPFVVSIPMDSMDTVEDCLTEVPISDYVKQLQDIKENKIYGEDNKLQQVTCETDVWMEVTDRRDYIDYDKKAKMNLRFVEDVVSKLVNNDRDAMNFERVQFKSMVNLTSSDERSKPKLIRVMKDNLKRNMIKSICLESRNRVNTTETMDVHGKRWEDQDGNMVYESNIGQYEEDEIEEVQYPIGTIETDYGRYMYPTMDLKDSRKTLDVPNL